MKNINDILNESLLDNENDLIKNTEKNFYYKKLRYVCDKHKYSMGCRDYFGRTLHVGDVVFFRTTKPHVVLISKLNNFGELWMIQDKDGNEYEAKHTILIPQEKLKDFLEIIS